MPGTLIYMNVRNGSKTCEIFSFQHRIKFGWCNNIVSSIIQFYNIIISAIAAIKTKKKIKNTKIQVENCSKWERNASLCLFECYVSFHSVSLCFVPCFAFRLHGPQIMWLQWSFQAKKKREKKTACKIICISMLWFSHRNGIIN